MNEEDKIFVEWLNNFKIQKKIDTLNGIYPPTKDIVKSYIDKIPDDLVVETTRLGDKENAVKYYSLVLEVIEDDDIDELYDLYLSLMFHINPSQLVIDVPPEYELSGGIGNIELSDIIFDDTTLPAVSEKVPRNNPCPCGSGKKYKKCCL